MVYTRIDGFGFIDCLEGDGCGISVFYEYVFDNVFIVEFFGFGLNGCCDCLYEWIVLYFD